MKIKTKFVSLSLSVEEIDEAIKDFLRKKDYELLNPITIEDFKHLVINSELVIDAQKQTPKVSSLQGSKISFPEIFISRLGGKNSIDVFLKNVKNDYLQKILNDVFNQINEEYRNVISVAFYLGKPFIGRKMSGAEIQKELHLNQNGSVLLRSAIIEFSGRLKPIFLEGLENNTLITKNNGKEREEILNIKTQDAGFSKRTFNCFKAADITTLGQLIEMEEQMLTRFRNFGQLGIEEIHIFKRLYNL